MICISIAQGSRRLALADLLNASRQCDLIELRLDRFEKAPEVSELLAARRKPVIMSCRRPQDGGDWQGTEAERLALLRQCIVSKADYVEIELDVADQIRPFPPSQRVISYTNLSEMPADIAEIYNEARGKQPDVIKLTTLARTPEEAWPLVQILARSTVPTVVVGVGRASVMLAVLGKKLGAPWTYAALELGMEIYPGQPTAHALDAVYHYRAIERSTRLIGVTGFGECATATVAVLNAALAHGALPVRCWPLAMDSPRLLRKVAKAAKLAAIVMDDKNQQAALAITEDLATAAEEAQVADLLLYKKHRWRGYYTTGRAAIATLEAVLKARAPSDKPLQNRMVMIAGVNAPVTGLARALQARGAAVILASRDRDRAKELAHSLSCRHVAFEAMYSTLHDVLVVCDEEKDPKARPPATGIHPGYLKPGMVVLDLTAGVRQSALLQEAAIRGCVVVPPRQFFLDRAARQARVLTGKDIPPDVLTAALAKCVEEEEPAR
jgi:3-dehydroquinate dehydratase/shikimate dehydrogenase